MTLSQKYVCSECAGNGEIKDEIFSEEKLRKTCGYCKKRRNCISIESLAKVVDEEYRNDYVLCKGGCSPVDIVNELLELNHSAGKLDEDLVSLLSAKEAGSSEYKDTKPMYDEYRTYRTFSECNPLLNDGSEHKEYWDFFCKGIQHRTRFFNNESINVLDKIFNGIEELPYKEGKSPIYKINPDDENGVFYRVRHAGHAQERIKICCHPTQELAAPPKELATNGRMNPIGVSVFYAAFKIETCIAELRLPVGETVVSGQFKLEKTITVFDLTIFDALDAGKASRYIDDDENFDYQEYADYIAFLKKFSAEISKPVSSNKGDLDYMPTQVLMEYLAYHYGIENDTEIDAVIYASTQAGGEEKNIVFLRRIAELVSDTTPESGLYYTNLFYCDFLGNSYHIVRQAERIRSGGQRFFAPHDTVDWDERENLTFTDNGCFCDDEKGCLSFVEGSVKLHKIKAVEYKTDDFDVNISESQL